jgi:hypothetical protein
VRSLAKICPMFHAAATLLAEGRERKSIHREYINLAFFSLKFKQESGFVCARYTILIYTLFRTLLTNVHVDHVSTLQYMTLRRACVCYIYSTCVWHMCGQRACILLTA